MSQSNPEANRGADADLRARLAYDDARLLAECVVECHRVRGPGGQHRNKTDSAVRLHHKPSGVVVTANERRSQHENKANAVLRLREALAVRFRAPLPESVVWPPSVQIHQNRLKCSEKNEAFYQVLALALDALAFEHGKPAEAAARLGVTSSSLTRFLADHPKAWAEANRIRQEAGLSPLKA